ncbi:hypothetical protein BXZ70DRAFT_895581 [Cristinia sonorae]|uniref:Uncharacterized protein n=1 Tax=Cristinia sonorae TaxID=1940300 RepID=A0A8K0ULU0_9AGAR|nr:hypothetical protein BXZ70DRAFT_895581 [Cristinia sonorae]
MSTSLNALASQFQAASLAIGSDTTFGSQHGRDESSASYRTSVSGDHDDSVSELALARAGVNPQGVETMLSLMMSRLENLERNQARLGGELEHVREELKSLKKGPADEKAKMKGKEVIIESNDVERKDQEEWQKRVEALETKVESIFETLKLEQARLYPRLQNAFVTLNKHPIKPLPVQGSGKAPANFPATKGEFEHLTKERYEQIMKAYSIPVKGDTAAKREAVREFIGLTPPGK